MTPALRAKLGPVRQVAYVVADIEKEMNHWVTALGVGPWFHFERATFSDYLYRGQPCRDQMGAPHISIALANSGALQIELIQQHCTTPTSYRAFTDAGRFGAQHIAFWSLGFDDHLALLERAGYAVDQSGDSGGGRFAYLVAPDAPDRVIELSDISGAKGSFFARIARIAETWDGTDPIRRFAATR